MGGGTQAVPPPSNATEKNPPLASSPPHPPSCPVFLRRRWVGDLGRGCSVSGPQEGEGHWGEGPPFHMHSQH